MMKKTWGLLALLICAAFALPQKGLAQASQEEALLELIAARLTVMREVAAFKYGKDLAVEDKEREAVVLAKSREKAEALGLDGTSVIPFFQQQIEAAKAIQNCWIGRWQSGSAKAPRFPRDLKTELRPQLIEIGAQINSTLAAAITDGTPLDNKALAAARPLLAVDCLPQEDADAVLQSLYGVKPAGS